MRAALLFSLAAVLTASAAPVPKALKKRRPDAEVFVGTWELVARPGDAGPPWQWTFDPDLTMWSKTVGAGGRGAKWVMRIDPEQSPKHIDFGETYRGIYEIDGDEIRIAYGGARPADFDNKAQTNYTVLRRVTADGR